MANVSQPDHDTVDQWLTQWPSLPPNATKLEPRDERKMEKRLHTFRPYSTPHAIMYRTLIEERDNRSCDLDDDRGLTSEAFTTGLQFVDDWICGKFVILDIHFLMYFAQSNVNDAMRTVDNETEERMMKSDGIIIPVHAHEHYGIVVLFRRGPRRGTAMLFDSDFVAGPENPPQNSSLYTALTCALGFATSFRNRLKAIKKQTCWPLQWKAVVSLEMLQQQDDYNCGVYATMKAMSLNFGTNALSHDLVRPTRFMISYAILGDLYWKEEADEDGNY